MSPVVKKRSTRRLLTTNNDNNNDQAQISASLNEIFNNSQHVSSSDQALTHLKVLYNKVNFAKFENHFSECLMKLFQSKQTVYSKTTTDFLCKFLQHISKLHDFRIIRTSLDVANRYMKISNDDCRYNALFFVFSFLQKVEWLDTEICERLKETLSHRLRDVKGDIRALAVVASRQFQDHDMIKDAFMYHFERDPDQTVRKALVQNMDFDRFGYEFVIQSTQDIHESIRKIAYKRIGQVSAEKLTRDQLHRVLHNGLYERDSQTSTCFKTYTLEPLLANLYDGLDLVQLLQSLDVVDHPEDMDKLLNYIHHRDLQKIENNGTATKLHYVVESFRDKRLNFTNKRLPQINDSNQNFLKDSHTIVTVWLSLIKFCKANQSDIKPVRVRIVNNNAANESIEKILECHEQTDELVELYERIEPDLVDLVHFVELYVEQVHLEDRPNSARTEEFTYQRLMNFIQTYEIGDHSERLKVNETLASILDKNLLARRFRNFVQPIMKCLNKLVHPSPNLMINYTAELINNVRSQLEDIADVDGSKLLEVDGRKMLDDHPKDKPVDHTKDLIRCFQMYIGCLQSTKVTEVPVTMKNLLVWLTFKNLCDSCQGDIQLSRLMIISHAVTALHDESFAKDQETMTLFLAACRDEFLEIRTVGYKSIVDVIVQHDVAIPEVLDNFLNTTLRNYGKYDPLKITNDELEFITTIVQGTAKLYYYRKLDSPEILSHLILWWYHPKTHSKLTQFIGVFMPMLVRDSFRNRQSTEDDWLENLLAQTYITSIEYLYSYIHGPGIDVMDDTDMNSLISFLSNLVPISFHPTISDEVDKRMDDMETGKADLMEYLKQTKKYLRSSPQPKRRSTEESQMEL